MGPVHHYNVVQSVLKKWTVSTKMSHFSLCVCENPDWCKHLCFTAPDGCRSTGRRLKLTRRARVLYSQSDLPSTLLYHSHTSGLVEFHASWLNIMYSEPAVSSQTWDVVNTLRASPVSLLTGPGLTLYWKFFLPSLLFFWTLWCRVTGSWDKKFSFFPCVHASAARVHFVLVENIRIATSSWETLMVWRSLLWWLHMTNRSLPCRIISCELLYVYLSVM